MFVSVLCQAAWRANLRLDADGHALDDPPLALHFVLLLDTIPADAFAARVGSGRDVAITVTDGRLTATSTGDWPDADRQATTAI